MLSRNGDRKIMQSIRIMTQTSLENKEVEPFEPVQMSIYQSNTYKKDLRWLHSDNEPRAQEWQHVKDQQSYISIIVAYLTIPNSSQNPPSTHTHTHTHTHTRMPNMRTVFHTWQYDRFIEIQSQLGRTKRVVYRVYFVVALSHFLELSGYLLMKS